MSLKLHLNGESTPVTWSRFPAGETFVRIDKLLTPSLTGAKNHAMIEMHFEGNDDLFNLALLVDALRRNYFDPAITLSMAYIPYARQDRVCSFGESLSIKVVADFINNLMLDAVTCMDVHSSVSLALFDRIHEFDLNQCAQDFDELFDPKTTVLVSPDAGANKKVLSLAKDRRFPHVVRADKTRDVLTGEITGTAVFSEHVGTKDFLIVDDICDGGRTFIELAKELRKLTDGKVMLYVTHGIFSKGIEVFDGLIDKVYTTNPVGATGRMALATGKVFRI